MSNELPYVLPKILVIGEDRSKLELNRRDFPGAWVYMQPRGDKTVIQCPPYDTGLPPRGEFSITPELAAELIKIPTYKREWGKLTPLPPEYWGPYELPPADITEPKPIVVEPWTPSDTVETLRRSYPEKTTYQPSGTKTIIYPPLNTGVSSYEGPSFSDFNIPEYLKYQNEELIIVKKKSPWWWIILATITGGVIYVGYKLKKSRKQAWLRQIPPG